MTAVQGDGGGVTEAEVEAGAAALDPRLFDKDPDPSSPFAHTLSRWRQGALLRARRVLEAAAAARPAPAGDADEVARLKKDLAEERKRTHTMAAGRQDWRNAAEVAQREKAAAETALAEARGLLRQFEWNPVQRQCQVCKQYQPGFWNIDPTEEGHASDCALAAILTTEPGDTA